MAHQNHAAKDIGQSFDAQSFRHVLGHYPTGVCVVTAMQPDVGPVGLVVGSFTSVSLDPPLVGFFAGRESSSWASIGKVGRFCVNVLSDDQHDLCRRFMKAEDRFAGTSYRLSQLGSPVLDGVVAWIDCTVHAVYEGGDHDIVLGEVSSLGIESGGNPLLFVRGKLGGLNMPL